ncbi:MAG: PEP-CTERM sorting domain-containing protein [Phycisphaerae bacterium]|nr:PEP-CTERM sorting domain-containing protein [Phycisphaerae bacterium]
MKRNKQGLCLWVAAACLVMGSAGARASLVAPNAGFEDPVLSDGANVQGTPVGWTRSSEDDTDLGTMNPGSSLFSPEAHGGDNVAYCFENCWIQYYTDETFQDGVTYTFTVYSGFTGSGSGGAQIQIRDITDDDEVAATNFNAQADSWDLITVSYTADSGDVGHGIGILIRSFSDGGYVLYDDVTLTPEPATLCLLSACGLAIMRRRR